MKDVEPVIVGLDIDLDVLRLGHHGNRSGRRVDAALGLGLGHPLHPVHYGDKGTLKLNVREYDFVPKDGGESVHGQWVDESDKYPEDHQHKEVEVYAGPATRRHMQNFLAARQEKKRPVSDIGEGYISTARRTLAIWLSTPQ